MTSLFFFISKKQLFIYYTIIIVAIILKQTKSYDVYFSRVCTYPWCFDAFIYKKRNLIIIMYIE